MQVVLGPVRGVVGWGSGPVAGCGSGCVLFVNKEGILLLCWEGVLTIFFLLNCSDPYLGFGWRCVAVLVAMVIGKG